MKYELEQLIYYMMDSRICSAPVLSRIQVENRHDDWVSNDEQRKIFARYGASRVAYITVHGEINEEDAYASKEEMLAALLSDV